MSLETFKNDLAGYLDRLARMANGPAPEDGFAGKLNSRFSFDCYHNVYISGSEADVTGWLCQYVLLPLIFQFAADYGYEVVLPMEPRCCPDVTLVASDGATVVLDIQTTHRVNSFVVKPFVLQSYAAYMSQHANGEGPVAHYLLGMIYTPAQTERGGNRAGAANVAALLRNCVFVLQEKWRIAAEFPPEKGTQVIVSVSEIRDLVAGNGPFACYDEQAFSHYWSNFIERAATGGD